MDSMSNPYAGSILQWLSNYSNHFLIEHTRAAGYVKLCEWWPFQFCWLFCWVLWAWQPLNQSLIDCPSFLIYKLPRNCLDSVWEYFCFCYGFRNTFPAPILSLIFSIVLYLLFPSFYRDLEFIVPFSESSAIFICSVNINGPVFVCERMRENSMGLNVSPHLSHPLKKLICIGYVLCPSVLCERCAQMNIDSFLLLHTC